METDLLKQNSQIDITDFKYFVFNKINSININLIFDKKKEDLNTEDINEFIGQGELTFKTREYDIKSIRKHNVVYYSNNGFVLLIDNQRKVISEKGDIIDFNNEKAKYLLINPDYKNLTDGLTYEQGKKLLEEKAKEYQEKIKLEFETETKNLNKNSFQINTESDTKGWTEEEEEKLKEALVEKKEIEQKLVEIQKEASELS